jgi:hypothetical protein
MYYISRRLLLQICSAAVVAVSVWLPTPGQAQDTTETASAQTETTSSISADDPATTVATEADVTANLNVVLLGEVVGPDADKPAEGPFPDLGGVASGALGGTITDLTTAGLKMEQLAGMAKSEVSGKPDVALIFTGFSDEAAETSDTAQRKALGEVVAALRAKNNAMRIFLIPASTNVGAITSANLRLAATEANATFIPIGTEVAGQPYLDAIEEVKAELAESLEPAETEPELQVAPRTAIIQGGQIKTGTAPTIDETATYEQKKASLQQELERVAGQAGDAAMMLPSLEDTATTGFVDSASTGTAMPPGGTLTKRGTEAKDSSIKMKTLPAVKAFRPQIPVPRNEVDVKEPALSR